MEYALAGTIGKGNPVRFEELDTNDIFQLIHCMPLGKTILVKIT